MSSEILKIVRAQKRSRRARSGWTTYYRIARKSEEGNWEYIDSRSSRKLAEKRIDEISKTYLITLIYNGSSRLISYAPTLWRSRQIIAEQIDQGQSIGYFRINYSKKPDCPTTKIIRASVINVASLSVKALRLNQGTFKKKSERTVNLRQVHCISTHNLA